MNSFKTSQKKVFKQKFGKKGVGKAVFSRAALAFDRATVSSCGPEVIAELLSLLIMTSRFG